MGNAIYLESDYNFIWSIGLIFQVLNEEIFLRSIVLKLLKRLTKSSYLIITLPAIFFMLLHFIFYRYSGEYLNLNVLAFLFVCGVILNWLRIYFHHIWFGYALHLAWNIPRFTGEYYSHGFMLTEAASYNLIEGNFNNLKTIIFIVFFSLTYCIFKKYIVLFRQKGRN
jgi:membrane protease YdiL (CAAX protease family)